MTVLDDLTLAKVATQEEMGELAQVFGKIDRFGWASFHPDTGETNLEALAGEIGDLYGSLHFLMRQVTNRLSEPDRRAFLDRLAARQNGKEEKLRRLNRERGVMGDTL